MKKTLIGLLLLIAMLPLASAQVDMQGGGAKPKYVPPIIEQEPVRVLSSGNNLCDVYPYCKKSIATIPQVFYINGSQHFIKKHWITGKVTFYDKDMKPLWSGYLDKEGIIKELSFKYDVEYRVWRADKIRMYGI